MTLHASRGSTGFGPATIAVSEVEAYCRFEGIQDARERRNVLAAVQYLDAEYSEHWAERQKRRRPAKR